MIDLRPLGVVCLLAACGGGTQASGSSTSPDQKDARGDTNDSFDGADSTVGAPRDPCASGTCTHCGDAVCLAGFYCEEAVSACGWVPECADIPSCDCLQTYLAGCDCDERSGGVFISCEG
jgi:hypothetical protein